MLVGEFGWLVCRTVTALLCYGRSGPNFLLKSKAHWSLLITVNVKITQLLWRCQAYRKVVMRISCRAFSHPFFWEWSVTSAWVSHWVVSGRLVQSWLCIFTLERLLCCLQGCDADNLLFDFLLRVLRFTFVLTKSFHRRIFFLFQYTKNYFLFLMSWVKGGAGVWLQLYTETKLQKSWMICGKASAGEKRTEASREMS